MPQTSSYACGPISVQNFISYFASEKLWKQWPRDKAKCKETGTCDRYLPFRREEKKKGIYKCILEIYWLNKCVSRYPELRLRETVATEWFCVVNRWNSFCSLCSSCDFVHWKQQSAAPANPFSPSWVFLGLCSLSSSMLAWNQINIFQRVLQMLFIIKVL